MNHLSLVFQALENMSESDLPVNKDDYIRLESLNMNFGAFISKDQEYVQHSGLAMRSLSAVMACLFTIQVMCMMYSKILEKVPPNFHHVCTAHNNEMMNPWCTFFQNGNEHNI